MFDLFAHVYLNSIPNIYHYLHLWWELLIRSRAREEEDIKRKKTRVFWDFKKFISLISPSTLCYVVSWIDIGANNSKTMQWEIFCHHIQ